MATPYATAPAADRALTLNERLNRMAETLGYQCERIEGVLARVNGTPQSIQAAGRNETTKQPTLPMGATVDTIEKQMQRLADLATGVESIA